MCGASIHRRTDVYIDGTIYHEAAQLPSAILRAGAMPSRKGLGPMIFGRPTSENRL
jgi:hypothetical protein